MTLSALIRKRDTGNLATAIPAISATQPNGEAATVARIATVAVANPTEAKPATSWGWHVTYPGGKTFESYITPEQTLAEVQGIYPGAKIEPIAEVAE